MSITKVVSAEDAVSVIHSGDVVASSGYGGHGVSEEVLAALETRFVESQSPRDLTLVWAGGQGDLGTKGLNHLGHEGLLKRTIGGHYGLLPSIEQLAVEEKIEAYNLPEGILVHLYRSIASGAAGITSTVGVGTFVDPRLEGGKVNGAAMDDLVELTEREDGTWLFYKGFPIDVALIRGTTADEFGNLTTEKEAASLEILELAMAAKASNGYVICQVEQIAEAGSLDSRQVRVPGILVDAVVQASPGNHMQTFGTPYNPAMSGALRVPIESLSPLELNTRTAIARRAAMELEADSVVNVGLGLPELVGQVAGDESLEDLVTFTVDTGVIGGVPLSGLDFGGAINREAVISHSSAFDFIDGGGLDTVFLGLAECDSHGNVNVSRFGNRIAGCGGAINLTQRSKNVVFLTPFTSGGLEAVIEQGQVEIRQEGRYGKFVDKVGQVTFSGEVALSQQQNITYVTERCVMKLGSHGLELTEIAPGVDMESQILSLLPFDVVVDDPRSMDKAIFESGPMGLREQMLDIGIGNRLTYDKNTNTVFMDFSGMHIRTPDDVAQVVQGVDRLLGSLDGRVNSVINYDRFNLDEAAVQSYADAVKYVSNTYYLQDGVTRYSTNAFMRLKLGRELANRELDPTVYESPEDADT